MSAIYPSDNAWEIPMLVRDLALPRAEIPLRAWGSRSRAREAQGGWHFYVDDYRFARVLRQPEIVEATEPTYCCEPNISITNQTPVAIAARSVYVKRYTARQWQDAGIPIVVDINVGERHQDLNLAGVPADWPTFSTRGRVETIESDWLSLQRFGEPTLIIVGGGRRVREIAQRLAGCVYLETF
jgi:hypothetical protein